MPPKTAGASFSSQPSKKKQKHTASGPQTTMGLKNLDPQQKTLFIDVAKKGLKQTKFFHIRILKALGLDQPVKHLLSQVGLENFIPQNARTFARLTFEFLATLKKGDDDEGKYIKFNVNDRTFKMSYDDVRDAFDWSDVSDSAFFRSRDYKAQTFFSAITPGLVWGNNRKVSSLPHPALRYIAVVLNMTVFCMGEPSNLTSATLRGLWTIVNQGSGCPNWVDVFVKSAIKLRQNDKGRIAMGGMVTLLVEWLVKHGHIERATLDWGTEISSQEEPLLDRYQLRARDMLWYEDVKDGPPRYIWLYGTQKLFYMALPQPRTRIDDSTTVSQLNLAPDEKYKETIGEFLGKTFPKRAREAVEGDDNDEEGDDTDDEEEEGDDDDTNEGTTDDEQSPKSTYPSRLRGLERRMESMQLQIDGLEDQVGDVGIMVSAMNDYFITRQDGYANPADAILEARRRRAATRAVRASGTCDPGGSSHE